MGNIRLSYILRPSDGRSTIEVFTFTSDLVGEQARWTMWGRLGAFPTNFCRKAVSQSKVEISWEGHSPFLKIIVISSNFVTFSEYMDFTFFLENTLQIEQIFAKVSFSKGKWDQENLLLKFTDLYDNDCF